MRPVVFLDIDGVLNSVEFFERTGTSIAEINAKAQALPDMYGEGSMELRQQCIDPLAVARLNTILRKAGAQVVLSTNWAVGLTVKFLVQMLERVGFEGEVIGKTPRKFGYTTRDYQVSTWLEQNREEGWMEYVILEDLHQFEPPLRAHVVRTDSKHGLQEEHVESALRILEAWRVLR